MRDGDSISHSTIAASSLSSSSFSSADGAVTVFSSSHSLILNDYSFFVLSLCLTFFKISNIYIFSMWSRVDTMCLFHRDGHRIVFCVHDIRVCPQHVVQEREERIVSRNRSAGFDVGTSSLHIIYELYMLGC